MSRRPPVSRAVRSQIFIAIAVLTAVMVGTTWLEHRLPTAQLPSPTALDQALPDIELVTCERTLPNADDSELVLGPVGRITSFAATACPRRFEGRLVTYVGEVVGDVLRRTGGAWVQMNDDPYALDVGPLPSHRDWSGMNSGLSVWLPEDLVDVIAKPGRRGLRGDILVIDGIFLRVDPADGGGLTIRATTATLLSAAKPIDRPLHVPQAIAACIAALGAIGLVVRERILRNQR